MKRIRYKFLPHTADIKFRAFGGNINECFENAAYAVIKSIYDGKVKRKIKKIIRAEGKDLESLLYSFLEQIIILLDSKNIFISLIKIKIDERKLKLVGHISGDRASNYNINSDIKAVTYNNMFVKKEKEGWVCQVVLDV